MKELPYPQGPIIVSDREGDVPETLHPNQSGMSLKGGLPYEGLAIIPMIPYLPTKALTHHTLVSLAGCWSAERGVRRKSDGLW